LVEAWVDSAAGRCAAFRFTIPNSLDSAHAFPPQYVFGSEGRNALRGPGYANLDFSVLRTFRIRKAMSLQFRAEFFNGLNHPSFSNPNGTLNNSQFGVISGASSPRDIQFGLKLVF
jgi:hypothetical protein